MTAFDAVRKVKLRQPASPDRGRGPGWAGSPHRFRPMVRTGIPLVGSPFEFVDRDRLRLDKVRVMRAPPEA